MDIGVIITGVIGIVTSFCSSWITWFLTRKRYYTEVDNNLIENMKESLDFYEKLSDDNTKRLEAALKRSAELENEVNTLRIQVIRLMQAICTDMTCINRKRDDQPDVIDAKLRG